MKFNNTTTVFMIVLIIQLNIGLSKRIKKRQIYREQVLPHTGGKIPDTAFETDRLALNRLQKEGIAIPDGVILEQRNPKVHQYSNSDLRPVFKVTSISDDRYTPYEGQYVHYMAPTSETTYPIPRITHEPFNIPIQTSIYQPLYRPFTLPNPLLQNPAFSPSYTKIPLLSPSPIKNTYLPPSNQQQLYSHQTIEQSPYSNYKFNNYPITGTHSKLYYHEDYVTSQIFNDLTQFLNRFGNEIPLRRR